MSTKQVIDSPRVPRLGPYSQAVRAGDLIYIAGQAGLDPATSKPAGDTFAAQARQAFVNLRTLLEDAGSGMDHVVKVTCFVTEAEGVRNPERAVRGVLSVRAAGPVESGRRVTQGAQVLYRSDRGGEMK